MEWVWGSMEWHYRHCLWKPNLQASKSNVLHLASYGFPIQDLHSTGWMYCSGELVLPAKNLSIWWQYLCLTALLLLDVAVPKPVMNRFILPISCLYHSWIIALIYVTEMACGISIVLMLPFHELCAHDLRNLHTIKQFYMRTVNWLTFLLE